MSKPFSQNAAAGSLDDADLLSILQSSGVTASGVDNVNVSLGSLKSFLNQVFLQQANNLSEIADAAIARANLGLGSAAVETIGSNPSQVPTMATVNAAISLAGPRTVFQDNRTGDDYYLVTIASAPNVTAYPLEHSFKVVFPATNSGSSVRIAIDGLGLKSCKTVTGVALPSGYIRANTLTEIWYDGTNFIVSREPETGTNSNGSYLRLANGYQACWSKEVATAWTQSWVFPAEFVSGSEPIVTGAIRATSRCFSVDEATPTTHQSAQVESRTLGDAASITDKLVHAMGFWY